MVDKGMKSTEKLPKNRILTQTGPKTTLGQWVALAALIDSAGYEGAAEALDRSQSSVNYQVARLQEALKCRLLKIRGRRAVLTETGAALLTRARGLLEDWRSLEAFAQSLKRGIEPVLKLIADAAFPREILIRTLLELKRRCPTTQVDLSDAVLSGSCGRRQKAAEPAPWANRAAHHQNPCRFERERCRQHWRGGTGRG